VSGELGLRKYLESHGYEFVVTSDKDGPNSVFERELADTEIVISQPLLAGSFWHEEGKTPDHPKLRALLADFRPPSHRRPRAKYSVQ